jgi:hypothetical protein
MEIVLPHVVVAFADLIKVISIRLKLQFND